MFSSPLSSIVFPRHFFLSLHMWSLGLHLGLMFHFGVGWTGNENLLLFATISLQFAVMRCDVLLLHQDISL